jgi:lipoprotein-anchoring transpeptidase ErfK/SrfK
MSRTTRNDSAKGNRRKLDRRSFMLGGASLLAATPAMAQWPADRPTFFNPFALFQQGANYGAIPGERFPVPPIDISRVDPRYLRQEIFYQSRERPGTIIVNPDARFLYLVLGNSRALRYGVGVGRQGFGWNGRATIQRKAAWPTWTPTENMIRRDPKLARYAGGMPPGLNNPLGARALYLFQNGQDTLYRLHGTNEPWSIGQALSSGCIRLFNQDIIDLHDRTPIGTQVVVLPHGRRSPAS